MCVGAHPDDESGAFGGALLLTHSQGIETQVLCLTAGDAASNRGEAKSAEELAQMRRQELVAANAILGVTRCEVLDYPDGKLQHENFNELVGTIVQRIRTWRPQVILTFGPDGGVNLHRDHTVVSLATTAAFHWAGRKQFFPELKIEAYTPQKLYYLCPPFFLGNDTEDIPRTPYSLSLELGELRDRKIDAFRAHRSQAPILDRIGQGSVRKYFATERYLLAAIDEDQFPVQKDSDFFSGVRQD